MTKHVNEHKTAVDVYAMQFVQITDTN